MPDETPQILDLDVLRASAMKFKEVQAALEARGRKLDEIESRLGAERISMGGRAMAVESVRVALQRGREKLARARQTMDQDAAAARADRLAVAERQSRLQELIPALEERDRLILDAENQLARRTDELTGRLQKSEARLRILAEREKLMTQRERDLEERATRLTLMGETIGLHEKKLSEREAEFIRRQEECFAVLESREKQVAAFRDAMSAMATEAAQRSESYLAMAAALKEEIDRVAVARDSAVAEGAWLQEAQEILTGTIDSSEADSEEDLATPGPFPIPDPPLADPESLLETTPELETIPIAFGLEEIAEPETRPSTMKDGAVGRLAQAIEAWERARAAGWNVSALRGHAKFAREALASGDYEGAMRSATTILTRLQTSPHPM